MSEPVETLDGWWALHDLRAIDWEGWRARSPGERATALSEAQAFFENALKPETAGSSGLYHVVGQKGDLLQIHFRPSLDELLELESAFDRAALAGVLRPRMSYLSVVELSTYGSRDGRLPEGDPLENPYLRRRLHPEVPPSRWVSFYPMDKRRGESDNWYSLPFEERRELMVAHGEIGRRYAGRVSQIITGSTGLDDHEWGVTLFADDPLQFKKIVYEMRFDEASARFGLFGAFVVGRAMDLDALAALLAR